MVVKNKISKKKVKKISLRKSKTNKTTTKRSKKKKTKKKISKEKIKQNIKKSYRKKNIRRSSTKKKKVKKTTQKKKKIRVVNKKYLKKMRISRLKSKRKRGLRVYTKKRRQKGGSDQNKRSLKKGISAESTRRQREDHQIKIRKSKKEERLHKRRMAGLAPHDDDAAAEQVVDMKLSSIGDSVIDDGRQERRMAPLMVTRLVKSPGFVSQPAKTWTRSGDSRRIAENKFPQGSPTPTARAHKYWEGSSPSGPEVDDINSEDIIQNKIAKNMPRTLPEYNEDYIDVFLKYKVKEDEQYAQGVITYIKKQELSLQAYLTALNGQQRDVLNAIDDILRSPEYTFDEVYVVNITEEYKMGIDDFLNRYPDSNLIPYLRDKKKQLMEYLNRRRMEEYQVIHAFTAIASIYSDEISRIMNKLTNERKIEWEIVDEVDVDALPVNEDDDVSSQIFNSLTQQHGGGQVGGAGKLLGTPPDYKILQTLWNLNYVKTNTDLKKISKLFKDEVTIKLPTKKNIRDIIKVQSPYTLFDVTLNQQYLANDPISVNVSRFGQHNHSNRMHFIKHMQRFDTFHDFAKGERKASPKGISVILKISLAIWSPTIYSALLDYLNNALFSDAREALKKLPITLSGSWEKRLREHTFANYSNSMHCIQISCKDKKVKDIYADLSRYHFGIILEEERLNKLGGLQRDYAYKVAKLFATKVNGIEMFGSMPCWYDPGSGTSSQMIRFYIYVFTTLAPIAVNIDPLLTTLITMPEEALYGIEDIVDIQLLNTADQNLLITKPVPQTAKVGPGTRTPVRAAPKSLGLALIYRSPGIPTPQDIFCGYVHKVSVNIIFQIMVLMFFLYDSDQLILFLKQMLTGVDFDNYLTPTLDIKLISLLGLLMSTKEKKTTIQTILVLFGQCTVAATSDKDALALCVKILLILKRAGDYGQLIGLYKTKVAAQKLLNYYVDAGGNDVSIKKILKNLANPVFESMDNALLSAAHSMGMYTLSKNIGNELEELKYYTSKYHWQTSNNPDEMLKVCIGKINIHRLEYTNRENELSTRFVLGLPGQAIITELNNQHTLAYDGARDYTLQAELKKAAVAAAAAADVATPDPAKVAAATAATAYSTAADASSIQWNSSTSTSDLKNEALQDISNMLTIMDKVLKIVNILIKINEHKKHAPISNTYNQIEVLFQLTETALTSGISLNNMCYSVNKLIEELIKIKHIKKVSYFEQIHFNKTKDLYDELAGAFHSTETVGRWRRWARTTPIAMTFVAEWKEMEKEEEEGRDKLRVQETRLQQIIINALFTQPKASFGRFGRRVGEVEKNFFRELVPQARWKIDNETLNALKKTERIDAPLKIEFVQ
jgi:hypothetical protein